jgi:uncharacterized repeat protein (TIGR03803 family)
MTCSKSYGTFPARGVFKLTPPARGVFKLTPPARGQTAWTETVLYSFTGGSDGGNPLAGLIIDAHGALYGTTLNGGRSNYGTVFKLAPPTYGQTAWKESVLHSFTGVPSDGANPYASLIFGNDGLYGTTEAGGNNNAGTVFKLAPPTYGQTAWKETVLYSFCLASGCADGSSPEASLIADTDGALYGTTVLGGSSACNGDCGTVFKLAPPTYGQTAWKETVLHSFTGVPSDGGQPHAPLIADKAGALYGTTFYGGINNAGTVFKLTPAASGQTASKETVLYSFCSATNCTDGQGPVGGLIADKAGALYGTTVIGGTLYEPGVAGIDGLVFKLTGTIE